MNAINIQDNEMYNFNLFIFKFFSKILNIFLPTKKCFFVCVRNYLMNEKEIANKMQDYLFNIILNVVHFPKVEVRTNILPL